MKTLSVEEIITITTVVEKCMIDELRRRNGHIVDAVQVAVLFSANLLTNAVMADGIARKEALRIFVRSVERLVGEIPQASPNTSTRPS